MSKSLHSSLVASALAGLMAGSLAACGGDAPSEAPAHEEPAVTNGLMRVGVQWGLLGDPSGLQLVMNSMGGTAFATPDNLEYIQLQLDVGATYTINDRIQPFANVSVAGRYRKRVYMTENMFVGVRYLFD